ncbi:TatD DNase family Scn1 [Auriculariales sp. MPI-PUGE-AT-0066]|nr:TatD DNase family Scn1 [Auriculariales sp. MPI-PUGE-AT-0066]
MAAQSQPPHPSLLERLTDVHAHPTDNFISTDAAESLRMSLCAMSTNARDQQLVEDLARERPKNIVPCFGWHPWWSHHIALEPGRSKEEHYRHLLLSESDASQPDKQQAFTQLVSQLPEPIVLDSFIADLRTRMNAFPQALLGEVGVDRIFRIPFAREAVAGDEIGRSGLSPFTVPVEHQLAVLEAQLAVAVDLGRNVSLHSVRAQQITVDLLDRMSKRHEERWKVINIDLHSCTLTKDVLQRINKAHRNVYCSLSTAINVGNGSENYVKLIEACPDDRLLVESDFPHLESCEQRTWDMLVLAARIKGWRVETEWEASVAEGERPGAARIVADNWKRFMRVGTNETT